jgi:hypothetical protein
MPSVFYEPEPISDEEWERECADVSEADLVKCDRIMRELMAQRQPRDPLSARKRLTRLPMIKRPLR